MNRILIVFLVLCVAIPFALTHAQAPEAQDEAANPKSEFDGKLVTVYVAGSSRSTGQILIDAELTEIGNRLMIVGTGADTGQDRNWTKGVRVGIPWDSVRSFYAMTEEQFDKKVRERDR